MEGNVIDVKQRYVVEAAISRVAAELQEMQSNNTTVDANVVIEKE